MMDSLKINPFRNKKHGTEEKKELLSKKHSIEREKS